jgi:16S rRNA (cytosine967-C5)-methyltransferase
MVRNTAVDVLLRVFFEGAYLNIALDKALQRADVSERGRRFLTQLVYGTTRHKTLCDHVLASRLHQPLDQLPRPVLAVLRMGVFQSLFLNQVTFPAMVHTSVELARYRGHAGMARVANAVLRKAPQNMEDVDLPHREEDPVRHLSVRYSMPAWLVRNWIDEFGEERAESICEASNSEAPTTIRVNTLHTRVDTLLAAFNEKEPMAAKNTPIPEELTLLSGPPPARSKRFSEGDFIIQDTASMLPPHLLEPKPGERVLDLCAAPGTKSTHLAQLAGGAADVIAMDLHPGKLGLVRQNAARLGIERLLAVCGDATKPPLRAGFDRVLVDAPCSGLGTLRRHPDLKWRAQPDAPARLAALQLELLRSAVDLCKNDGLVVYSVCTFTRAETTDVARAVTQAAENVVLEEGPEWLRQWQISPGQYRILPEKGGLDGFFLMRLRKRS